MAEFTRDIKQLQQTASQQPQFAPPSQSLGGDIVNLIGTGLDFYAKGQAQDKLEQMKLADIERNRKLSTGKESLRQVRLLAQQGVSSTEILKREQDVLKTFDPQTRWEILSDVNTVTKTTTKQAMSDSDAAALKQKTERETLEMSVNELSPYIGYEVDLNAPEGELRTALMEGKAKYARQQARKAEVELESSILTKEGEEADIAKDFFLMDYAEIGTNAYSKQASSLLDQADFNDPAQIKELMNKNAEFERAFVDQAVASARQAGIRLTPSQAKEQLAPQLEVFKMVSSNLSRKDVADIGANQFKAKTQSAILAMSQSENANQRNLAALTMLGNLLPQGALEGKMFKAYGGALVDNVGDDMFSVFFGGTQTPTPEQVKEAEAIKQKGNTFLKDVFKNADDNVPEATKVELGNTMKEKLQGSRATRNRMINEGGFVTYVQAMSGGAPELLLTAEDREEIMMGVVDYGEEFLRRAIPQLLGTPIPAETDTFTKPIFPSKRFEVGLPTTKAMNKMNALEPDTLKVTWNQSAPISQSVRAYNKFVDDFFVSLDKLGATEEEVKYLKNEIARGFIVANP